MKLKLISYFVALIIVSYSSLARDLIIDSNFFIRNGKFEMLLGNAQGFVFEVNLTVLREIFTSDYEHIVFKQFPLFNSKTVDLKLERAMMPFDQNTEFYVGKKGSLVKTKAPTLMVLSGKIVGLENSFVFLTVTEFGILGTIQESDGVIYSITPNMHSKINEHILLDANAIVLNEENIFKCLTEDYVGKSTEAEDLIKFYKDQDVPLAKKPLLEVRLACEGTNDFFKIFGDSKKALAYMTAVIAQSSKIYQEFFNVRLYIGYAVVWEDEWDDPYYGTKNLSEKLQKMPSIWRNKSIDRALTVLFANLASQPANETVAGISFGGTPYYGSLCSKDWGYCVLGIRGNATYPTLNYTWDVNVATHEIGHNFSLPHTHNCYWQPNMIDTCVTGETYGVGDACIKTGQPVPRPGTIMSYCHLTNPTHSVQLIFHPRELPLARTAAERSKCVSQVSAPYISLLNPLGDKTYVSGEILPIRWTSANVNYLTIFFSSDKGATWSIIADNVPAPDSVYLWNLPFINTTKALIYIRDKSNPNVADTSLKTFSIKSRTLQITTPTENEEFAVGETINISWNATLVDTFNLYFSQDGGKNYSVLASNMIQNYYELIAPSINSDECKFKVTSLDGKIVAESPLFKIGNPTGSIIFPNGGEVFCMGAAYAIKWTTKYVNKIVLEYSVDNGKSWKRITLGNLDAKIGKYVWKVPNKTSNECLVRIKPTFTDVSIDVSDNVFVIDSCQAIGGIVDKNFSVNELVKNVEYKTDENLLRIEFANTEFLPSTPMYISDVLGNIIYSETLNPNSLENNCKTIKLSNIVQGVFFVILNFDGRIKTFSTVIIK